MAKEKPLVMDSIKQCPECGSDNIYHSKMRLEIVCKECGSIFNKMAPKREEAFRKASNIV